MILGQNIKHIISGLVLSWTNLQDIGWDNSVRGWTSKPIYGAIVRHADDLIRVARKNILAHSIAICWTSRVP